MDYLSNIEQKLAKQRLARNGGFKHKPSTWIMLTLAYLVVFSVLMYLSPWGLS